MASATVVGGRLPLQDEHIVMRSKGSPYSFVKSKKEWQKLGDNAAIMLLMDKSRNACRLVAVAEDNVVLLDCDLGSGVESELRKNFLQWKHGGRIWGVKFGEESVAQRFQARFAASVAGVGNQTVGATAPAVLVATKRASPPIVSGGGGEAPIDSQRKGSRKLFESLSLSKCCSCCVCGALKNELLLKVVGEDNRVEGEPLLLETLPRGEESNVTEKRRLCTKCWVENLKKGTL